MTTNTHLQQLVRDGKDQELWRLLENGSHLPGPRANLELIHQFVASCVAAPTGQLREMLCAWLRTPVIDAPINSPAEFPVACAAAGLAAWVDGDAELVLPFLIAAARDQRWRTREAVTIGLQQIGRERPAGVLAVVRQWGVSGDPFLERAALVTLADSPLLKNPGAATLGLDLVDQILRRLQELPKAAQKTEGNAILNKGLAFTISVFVAASPGDGFARMERWLMASDTNTRRILNENLGKARLSKHHAVEVAKLKGIEFEINDWDRH